MSDAATRKNARPRQDWQQVYLEEYAKTGVVKAGCEAASVSRATVQRERIRNEEFAVAEHDAREQAMDTLEAVLRLRASGGQPLRKLVVERDAEGKIVKETETTELLISTSAAMFLLKRYRPEFRESFRVENTGPGGGPIQHEVKVERSLEDFYAELDRLAETNGDLAETNGSGP